MRTKFHLTLLCIAVSLSQFYSCKKKEITSLKPSNEVLSQSSKLNEEKSSIVENNVYMQNVDLFDLTKLSTLLKDHENVAPKTSAVWGVGGDNRVYKWNGSNWQEPNAAARLYDVDVSEAGGAVWGIGSDYRVYKWTGSYWQEPNPNAGLYQISSLNASIAVGRGGGGKLYITTNGGTSWSQFTTIMDVKDVSVGNVYGSSTFCWVVKSGTFNTVVPSQNGSWTRTDYAKLFKFNLGTNNWDGITTYASAPGEVEAVSNKVWYLSANYFYDPFLSFAENGNTPYRQIYSSPVVPENIYSFLQPNSNARLLSISSSGNGDVAWGIGALVGGATTYKNNNRNGRVWRTVNGGQSWTEPNPNAALRFVSFGFE